MNYKTIASTFAAVFAAMGVCCSANAEVTSSTLYNPSDGSDVWGERIEGLGEYGDEVALVFSKLGAKMDWTLPSNVNSIRYLIVGGGASGGYSGSAHGGGGGGAGEVLQAGNYAVSLGAAFSVTVGGGGAAVKSGGAGNDGAPSVLEIDGNTLTAHKGGGGGKSQGGARGGANYGCGGGAGGSSTGKSTTVYDGGVGSVSYGGSAYAANSRGAGGGGAGGNGQSNSAGGRGGSGVGTTIFSDSELRIAGGGGGCPNGRTGTQYDSVDGGGKGGYRDANGGHTATGGTVWGAGGGGAGGSSSVSSGAGYQGVVVVRYVDMPVNAVEVPLVQSVTYDGELHTAVVPSDARYTVMVNDGGINAGDYVVTLRLAEGYMWRGGSTADTNLVFTVNPAENAWTVEPALSKTAWEIREEPATVTSMGEAYGEVTLTYDNDLAVMPTTIGVHTAHFTVAPDANHRAMTKDVVYTVSKNTNAWDPEPALTRITWGDDEDPATTNAYGALYGEITVVYDNDENITEMPTNRGAHSIVFSVSDGEEYTAISKTINYAVTKWVNGWTKDPVVTSYIDIEDADPMSRFVAPESKHGDVTFYFDGDTECTEFNRSRGVHTVTYVVAEGDDYLGYSRTYSFRYDYKLIPDPDDSSKAYGYRIPNLGEDHNEVAFVFTNITYTSGNPMSLWIPKGVPSFRYLVVGGGGGGGGSSQRNGGGGAGGLLASNDVEIAGATGIDLAVVAGARGAGGSGDNGQKGGTSRLYVGDAFTVVAEGGGAGGGANTVGGNGGCGGGAGGSGVKAGGTGSIGGNGGASVSGWTHAGGGGGMGGDGCSPESAADGPSGGPGIQNDTTGENVWYCAGGGGSNCSNAGNGPQGLGGEGGGGNGAYCVSNQSQEGGNATTYGSGGGGAWGSSGGKGYQGIVIVRYAEEKPQNCWTVDPAISKETWIEGEVPAVLTPGMSAYGEVAAYIVKDGVLTNDFSGTTLPVAPGEYEIVYDMSLMNDYYPDRISSKSVRFSIVGDDVVPPFSTTVTSAPALEQVEGKVNVRFGYSNYCEVVSAKTVDIRAIYWYGEDADITNEVVVASGVTLDAVGTAVIPDCNFGTNLYMMVYGKGGDTSSTTSEVYQVTIPAGSSVSASATYDNEKFYISGTVVPGLGATTATVYWSLNSDAMDQTSVYNLVLGDDGQFTVEVPYTSADDYVVWRVEVSNTFGSEEWSDEIIQQLAERAADSSAVTYTWTGAANDGAWTNMHNWTANKAVCKGYPNSKSYATASFPAAAPVVVSLSKNISTYAIKVAADADVKIDLDGHKLTGNTIETKWNVAGIGWQYVWDSAEVGANAKFTLANGTWDPCSGSVQIAGNNAEVVFTNVTCAAYTDGNGAYLVNARGNSNGSVSGWKVTIVGHDISAPRGICGNGGSGSKVVVDGCVFTANSNSCGLMMGMPTEYVAINGGTITTGNGGWQAITRTSGTYGAIGSGSSATFALPTGSTYAHGFNCRDTVFFALDGATLTIPNNYNSFTADSSRNNDLRNEFICSNATINITGSQEFKFGTLGSGKCDSPTITLGGDYVSFKPNNAFVFGSNAELEHPPVLNLIPTSTGFSTAAIRSTKNITFGTNVTVRVNPAQLGTCKKIAVARTTATLTADVQALADRTTFTDDVSRDVTYAIEDVVDGSTWHTLFLKIKTGLVFYFR